MQTLTAIFTANHQTRRRLVKKLSVVLLAIFLLIGTVSCSPTMHEPNISNEEGVTLEESVTAAEEETATTEKETTKTTTTKLTTTTTTTKKTTTTAPFASRKNPAVFGESVVVTGTEWDGSEFKYIITVTNLRRGEEARQLAMSYNRFNEIPDGQEAIIFDVEFLLEEYDQANDDSYRVSYFNFDYYTSTYTSFRGGVVVGSKNELSGDLYEGGSLTGDVIMCIPEDDHGYLLFKDFVWFEIP